MPDSAYEHRDVLLGNYRRWATVLTLFVLIGSGLAMGFFWLFAPSAFRKATEIPNASLSSGPLPQDNATALIDIADLRAGEREILENAGPSLVHPGARRIPIEEAMRRLAAAGMPPRPGSPTPTPEPLPAGVPNNGAP